MSCYIPTILVLNSSWDSDVQLSVILRSFLVEAVLAIVPITYRIFHYWSCTCVVYPYFSFCGFVLYCFFVLRYEHHVVRKQHILVSLCLILYPFLAVLTSLMKSSTNKLKIIRLRLSRCLMPVYVRMFFIYWFSALRNVMYLSSFIQ